MIPAEVTSEDILKEDMCLIEQAQRSYDMGRGIVAKCLVRGQQKFPVRILNPTQEEQILFPRTVIATASPVLSLHTVK